MINEFDLKFINFLKKYNLYDENTFKYIKEQSILCDFLIDEYDFVLGSCHIVVNNKNGLLEQIIPCMPKLLDDYSVMIAIYTYVNALLLIPKLNKTYSEDTFYHYFLPLFYKKIYILESSNIKLLEHEKEFNNILLNIDFNKFNLILNLIDKFIKESNNVFDNKKMAKKIKRVAKTYIK